MRQALEAEWRKVVTTRTWWILALVMFGYMLFLGAIIAFALTHPGLGSSGGSGDLDVHGRAAAEMVYTLAASFGYAFPLLVGALAMTSEFRHRTITPTLLVEPRRGVVLGAKLAVNLGVGVVYGVAGTLGALAGGAPLLGTMGDGAWLTSGPVLADLGFCVLALALWAAIGVGVGSLLVNQVAAVIVILAFTQFVEPVLRLGLGAVDSLAGASRFLPGAAAEALSGSSFYSTAGMAGLLDRWQGGLVLLGYAVGLAVAGRLTTLRRDVG
ncbi:MAG TPA: ABC transporter permease [Marmoricola sp.]|nr:ABC transporter permease [Marmoricola sp.]